MRQQIIAGNWKMHMTLAEAIMLTEGVKEALCSYKGEREVVLCPPFTALGTVADLVEDTAIAVGAQNMHYEPAGAYTGEISPVMLTDIGCKYVIIGHSERRQYFGESNETINKKIKAAITHALVPILCVGESLVQRESGLTVPFITAQLETALSGVSGSAVADMVIAYEPIWAIGTGKTASAAQAQEVCCAIRDTVQRLYDTAVADAIRVQYGGSVKGSNAAEILAQPDIDGALVGGASLKAEDFVAIING